MTRKVLLTSLSDMGHSLSPRYFSVRGEFGYYYCDALLDAEASIKAALARFSIDEIIILGSTGSYDEGDELSTIPPQPRAKPVFCGQVDAFQLRPPAVPDRPVCR